MRMGDELVELERALAGSRRRLEAVASRLASLRERVQGEEGSADDPLAFEDEAGDHFEARDYEDPERGR